MKVEFYLGIGLASCEHKEIVEYPDGTPDEEIEEGLKEWAWNYIDMGWGTPESESK